MLSLSDEPTEGLQASGRRASLLQRDGILLALLLLFAAGLHAWVIVHTEVAARDSIAFIRYAWRLDHEPLTHVLKESLHPPLYPLTVLGASVLLRPWYDGPQVLLMQYSAQVASTLAGLLLIFPMFYMGKRLFNRLVGFWSALLFQCLPVGSRALSDGLTEGLFLLLIATGLLLALRAFRTGSALCFGLIGLCAGLAYLTRPEGAMLLVAAGLVLMTARRCSAFDWTRFQRLRCLASLGLAALAVSLPYMVCIGGITKKTTGIWIIEWFTQRAHAVEISTEPGRGISAAKSASPLLAEFSQDWKEYHHVAKLSWAFRAICREAGKSFHYIAWLPMLLGLWWFRRLWNEQPGVRVLLVLCVLHLLLVLRVAVVAGYVSERHTLLLVLCGCPWAIAGTIEFVRRLSPSAEQREAASRARPWWRRPQTAELALLLLLVLSGLPGSIKSLHSNRAGHRAAGAWLAEHARPWDEVFDPFCWAGYYAGRVFCEGIHVDVPPGETAVRYVVMDNVNHHSRIPQMETAREYIKSGTIRFEWPNPATGKRSTVQVYEVPLSINVAQQ